MRAAFTGGERGRAIGTWSGFSAITTAIGPVMVVVRRTRELARRLLHQRAARGCGRVQDSLRYVEESKDPSRTGKTDWAGAACAVVGLCGVVLGLLEWPPLGAKPLVIGRSSLASSH